MTTSKNSNYLYSGFAWNKAQSAAEGSAVTLTYSYLITLPDYYRTFQTFSSAKKIKGARLE